MATIKIIDPSNVLIDGSNAGQVMDVVRNHPQYASAVQLAFAEWYLENQSERNTELESAITTAAAEAEKKLADAKQALEDAKAKAAADLQAAEDAAAAAQAAALAQAQAIADQAAADLKAASDAAVAQLAAIQADADAKAAMIAEQAALIDAMGGTELGKKLAAEKRAKELQAAIDAANAAKAAAQAELDKLAPPDLAPQALEVPS